MNNIMRDKIDHKQVCLDRHLWAAKCYGTPKTVGRLTTIDTNLHGETTEKHCCLGLASKVTGAIQTELAGTRVYWDNISLSLSERTCKKLNLTNDATLTDFGKDKCEQLTGAAFDSLVGYNDVRYRTEGYLDKMGELISNLLYWEYLEGVPCFEYCHRELATQT